MHNKKKGPRCLTGDKKAPGEEKNYVQQLFDQKTIGFTTHKVI